MLKAFILTYSHKGEQFTFHCQADDSSHAIEQLLNAEPHATQITVEPSK